MTTDLIKPKTAVEMATAYAEAEREVRAGYDLLETARVRLRAAFGEQYSRFKTVERENSSDGKEGADRIMKSVKHDAWSVIVDRMELRRAMSCAARKELDQQLAANKDLPAVTQVNILAMCEKTYGDLPKHIAEAVTEVYNWLRPRRNEYKTNSQFRVGRKVILNSIVSNWHGDYYSMSSGYEQELTALDNVFHMLAGQGTVKTYHGPLYDALHALVRDKQFGVWTETEFFRAKVFRKGTAHIEFKRQDLVDRLNQMAGADKLGETRPTNEEEMVTR